MFGEKLRAVQSAGMEDGLIDVIVVQLLVRMYKKEQRSDGDESEQNHNYLLLDEKPWYWDLDLEI